MTHRSTTPGAKPRRASHASAAGMLALMATLACGDPPTAPELERQSASADLAGWIGTLMLQPWLAAAGPPVLVGAGDIARCYPASNPTNITAPPRTPAAATARLLDQIPGTVMAVGDNAYEYGSPIDYRLCYHPTWGRHRARTRPAAGNHEYLTPGAAGYFTYFGAAAAPPGGYYSYDLGSWHVVVLNSTPQWAACPPPATSPEDGERCVGDVPQRTWLITDLADHGAACTVVYFHHPRYSSGKHGSQYEMQQFWDIMVAAGVDVVVSAHDHLYERFARQDQFGNAPETGGIRQFTVGTGGTDFYGVGPWGRIDNSEALILNRYGVLALSLGEMGYGWAFVSAPDGAILDSGSDSCH
ncbi:MAG TPA: metallophosphoesterase [Gemmatimonadaceae bacterium]|nr:metallophosphoesterase [Gemmatimonadaceae bacterium]